LPGAKDLVIKVEEDSYSGGKGVLKAKP